MKPFFRYIVAVFVAFTILVQGSLSYAFTLEDERKLGKELYDKLQAHHLLYKDKRANDYINSIGNRVLATTNQHLFDFTFSIVNSSAINAFATPGGYVYLNKGLITMVDNESELAGVIAHEISHITSRHIAKRIEQSKKMNYAALAGVLAGILLGGGGVGTEALMGISIAGTTAMQLKYSRENEEEADRLGMNSLVGAGYDPRGMLTFMKIMKNFEYYSSNIPSYFLTHPGTEERIRYIDGLIQTRYKTRGSTGFYPGLSRIQTLLLLSEKDTDMTQKNFENKLKKNAKDVDALYGLAVIQGRMGKMDDSLRNFTKAIRIAPDDEDVLRGLGIHAFNSGNMSGAVDYLRRAFAIDPKDDEAMTYLARAYEETGDFGTALLLYQELRKMRPDDETIYYNLGMNFGRTGNQAESHYNFGLFNQKKNKYDSALFHYQEALKFIPAGDPRIPEIQKSIEDIKKNRKPAPPPKQKKLDF